MAAFGDLAALAALAAGAFLGAAFFGEAAGLATLGLGALTAAFLGAAAGFLATLAGAAAFLAAGLATFGLAAAGADFLTAFFGEAGFLAAALGFLGEVTFLATFGFFSAAGLTFLGFKASAAMRKDPAAPADPYLFKNNKT